MSVEMSVKEFVWPVRVYYEDTDSGGVVYYANYLKFMERARSEWMRSVGFEQDRLASDPGIVFIVRSASVDFLRPAVFNDLLRVRSQVTQARRVSLVFDHEILRMTGSDDPLCRGRVKVACVDAAGFRPRPIPRTILAEIVGDS
jgi:acyl-CoA thioester hydrolase